MKEDAGGRRQRAVMATDAEWERIGRAAAETRLRRFAIGLIKGRGLAVAETMRNLARNPRRVLDFLKMTDNAAARPAPG